jgi:DNA-binding IclR family transcriptional regulator
MTRSKKVELTPQTPSGVDVLDRAFSILFSFRADDAPLTLSELSQRTGLYKSTILRLAGSLIHHRFLLKLEDGRYRLGPAAFSLGSIYQAGMNVGEVLLPLMRNLNKELGEAISFHIREGNVRICLYRINSTYNIGPQVKVGDIQSLERGAGGRVLLAFSGQKGEPYDTARRRYYYMSWGERDPETAGISAPVFGGGQKLIGALGIVGPVSRVDIPYMEKVKGRLLSTASLATESLGGDPTPLRQAAVAADNGNSKGPRPGRNVS